MGHRGKICEVPFLESIRAWRWMSFHETSSQTVEDLIKRTLSHISDYSERCMVAPMYRLGTHHLAVGALLVLCSITSIVHAAIQSVHLEPGWNLVFSTTTANVKQRPRRSAAITRAAGKRKLARATRRLGISRTLSLRVRADDLFNYIAG